MNMRRFIILTFFGFCMTMASPSTASNISMSQVVLRGLDKLTGRLSTMTIDVGQKAVFGALDVYVRVCYMHPPEEVPENASFLEIVEKKNDTERKVFSGWMFSSSPALSAMEHPVYDVWVLKCQGVPKVAPDPEPLVLKLSEEDAQKALEEKKAKEEAQKEKKVSNEAFSKEEVTQEAVVGLEKTQETPMPADMTVSEGKTEDFIIEDETALPETPVAPATEEETALPETPIAPATEDETASPETPVAPATEDETALPETPVAPATEDETALQETEITEPVQEDAVLQEEEILD